MHPGPHHEVANLQAVPGELSFEARIGGEARQVWFRSETPVTPPAEVALATCLMPAMRLGGTLELGEAVSPRLLRAQREFQAIQRAWSLDWEFGDPPLREVEVAAPTRVPPAPDVPGRVAAFFSGGVDSWSTILANPDVTDLIFVRGIDLMPKLAHQGDLADRVEERLREAAAELGLPLHVVATNLRELTDPLARWEAYYGCAVAAVAHFFSPLFERVLIAGDSDYEVQMRCGANWMVDQLLSTEQLEIVDDGGRRSRIERLAAIAGHPVVRQTLRVCWENPGGAYNCGRCRKCLMTMIGLEALGARSGVVTFPPELDLDAVAAVDVSWPVLLTLWEDLLDATRAAGRTDLERVVEAPVAKARRQLGLAPDYRRRRAPGPPATVRLAVVVPAWNQSRYLAGAVRSALDQELGTGVGVVVVNDGCPDPETDRVGQALRDADPGRVAYLHQANAGLAAARNAGIRLALARWPEVEAVFPLDADNLLSPDTLARLSARLEEDPGAAWAYPALEFFGAERGEWRVPGPYLPYRQLLSNQCDAGSLIRRAVFEAGIGYDETMRDGFEDWEFFLRATLAGFRGVAAGRCGFRYRRQPDSMVATALERAEQIEAAIRERHPRAYEPAAVARREHAEAPRFALVRCDREDVLLTAACDLEPRQLTLAEFARSVAAANAGAPDLYGHIPSVTVLTTAATIAGLEAGGALAATLFRLQTELRGRRAVGLGADPGLAVAVRASALAQLAGGAVPELEATVAAEGAGGRGEPLPAVALSRAATLIGLAAAGDGRPLPITCHTSFLEHRHLEEGKTTFPLSEPASIGATA
jgi:glycosyltransferase involved in cell wall biosynthesis